MKTLLILLLLTIPCYAETLQETIYGDLIVEGDVRLQTVTATTVSGRTVTGNTVYAGKVLCSGKGSFDTLDITSTVANTGIETYMGGFLMQDLSNFPGSFQFAANTTKAAASYLYADGNVGTWGGEFGWIVYPTASVANSVLYSTAPIGVRVPDTPNGTLDADDYMLFRTVNNVPEITIVGGSDLTISASIRTQSVTADTVSATTITGNTVWSTGSVYGKGYNANVVNVSNNCLISLNDDFVIADTSNGAFTITLPSVVKGKVYHVKLKASKDNVLTITGNTVTETIEGDNGLLMDVTGHSVSFISDADEWHIF